jgi:hypothetical protein
MRTGGIDAGKAWMLEVDIGRIAREGRINETRTGRRYTGRTAHRRSTRRSGMYESDDDRLVLPRGDAGLAPGIDG